MKFFDKIRSLLSTTVDGKYFYFDGEDRSLLVKNYRAGKLDGPSLHHYNSGELWIEENYVSGEIHGTTTYYNKDGSIKTTQIWEHCVCK